MKFLIFTILASISLYTDLFSQTFLSQIKVGQKMPQEIRTGGFIESKGEDCSCKVYTIEYEIDKSQLGNGGANLAETIGIHYDQNNIVTGIINISLRTNEKDAYTVYIGEMSEFLRNQSMIKDWKFINARDTNGGIVDGIFYFTYSYQNGELYKSIGVIKSAVINETFIPNSSYTPKLKN